MTKLTQAFQEIVETRRSVRIYDQTAEFDPQVVRHNLELATLAPNSSNLQLWEFYRIKTKEAKQKIAKFCLDQPAAKTANELVVVVARQDHWDERAAWNLKKVEASFKKEGVDIEKVKATKDAGNVLNNISKSKVSRLKSVQQYYGKLIPQLYQNDALGVFGRIKKLYVDLVMAPKKPAYREVLKSDIRVIVHKSCALAAQTFMLGMTASGYDTCPMEGIDSKRIKDYLNLPSAAEVNMVISCGKRKPEGVYGKRVRVPKDEVIFEV